MKSTFFFAVFTHGLDWFTASLFLGELFKRLRYQGDYLDRYFSNIGTFPKCQTLQKIFQYCNFFAIINQDPDDPR